VLGQPLAGFRPAHRLSGRVPEARRNPPVSRLRRAYRREVAEAALASGRDTPLIIYLPRRLTRIELRFCDRIAVGSLDAAGVPVDADTLRDVLDQELAHEVRGPGVGPGSRAHLSGPLPLAPRCGCHLAARSPEAAYYTE